MNQTLSTSQTPSNSTEHADSQAKTLSSFCNWWMNSKEEVLPGICHWFIHPQENMRDSSVKFIPDSGANYSTGHISVLDDRVHSTESMSLILILGGVLFILLLTAFITCISRRRSTQVGCFKIRNKKVFILKL